MAAPTRSTALSASPTSTPRTVLYGEALGGGIGVENGPGDEVADWFGLAQHEPEGAVADRVVEDIGTRESGVSWSAISNHRACSTRQVAFLLIPSDSLSKSTYR